VTTNTEDTPPPTPLRGYKADQGKVRMALIPPEAVFALATVLTEGAQKYADRNWEQGMSWGRVFSALMRHMWAWWGGRAPTNRNFLFGDLDPETGHSHLWHGLCCLAFLLTYEARGMTQFDDRSPHPIADPENCAPEGLS
jgi:Domain of unknown function (DUF5664)